MTPPVRPTHSHVAWRLALRLALALAAVVPAVASAQPVWGPVHTTSLSFASGSQSGSVRNGGYDQATATVQYRFAACNGNVYVHIRLVPSTLRGSGYWMNGQRVAVPASAPAPTLQTANVTVVPFTGVARYGNGVVARFDGEMWTHTLSEHCNMGFRVISTGELGGSNEQTGSPPSQYVPALQLAVSTSAPLKSSVPDYVDREERERHAEAARAGEEGRQAEAARQQAEASRQRQVAEAPRAAPAQRQGTAIQAPAPAPGGRTAALPSGASYVRGTDGRYYVRNSDGSFRPTEPAEQAAAQTAVAAAERAAAQAREAAATAETSRLQEEARQRAAAAQQATDEAQRRQESIDAAASAAGDFIGNMIMAASAERNAQIAREEARAAQRAVAAEAARVRREAAYAAAGPRPKCTAADVRSQIRPDQFVNGTISPTDCRGPGEVSVAVYDLEVDRAMDYFIEVNGYQQANINIVTAGGEEAPWRNDYVYQLKPGNYRVRVTAVHRGDSFHYAFQVRTAGLSKVNGSQLTLLGTVNSVQVGSTGATNSDYTGGLRLGRGFLDRAMLFGEALYSSGSVNETTNSASYVVMSLSVGGRLYVTSRRSRLRPYAEGSLGYYRFTDYSGVDDLRRGLETTPFLEDSKGPGHTAGIGFQFYPIRLLSLDLGVRWTSMSLSEPDEDTDFRTPPPAPTTLSSTSFLIGATFPL